MDLGQPLGQTGTQWKQAAQNASSWHSMGGSLLHVPADNDKVDILLCGLSCGCVGCSVRCAGCAAASSEGNSVRKCGEEGGGSDTQPPGPAPAATMLLGTTGVGWKYTFYNARIMPGF